MKIAIPDNRAKALALIEVLIVLAIILLLVALLVPRWVERRARTQRIACVNNLKQIGVGFHTWSSDSTDRFVTAVSTSRGGTMELTGQSNTYRHFQAMSNELSTPRILFCPSESDPARTQASTFVMPSAGPHAAPFTGNRNLSYFVGVDAGYSFPTMFLSGDRNITNGTPVIDGILDLNTNRVAGWTGDLHRYIGNVCLADASVEAYGNQPLQKAIQSTGFETNRLALP